MNKECLSYIRSIYRTIASFEQTLQKQFGLNINEVMLLIIVSEKINISSSEIASEMGLTPSNASKVIASLEKRKLIVRHACKEDLRCMKFCISKSGEEMLAQIDCDHVELPEPLFRLIHSMMTATI